MFCDNCGHEIEAGQKFCRFCGFRLEDAEDGPAGEQVSSASRNMQDADQRQVVLIKIMEKGEEKKKYRIAALGGIFFAILFLIAALTAESGWVFGILVGGNVVLLIYCFIRCRKCEDEENELKNRLC